METLPTTVPATSPRRKQRRRGSDDDPAVDVGNRKSPSSIVTLNRRKVGALAACVVCVLVLVLRPASSSLSAALPPQVVSPSSTTTTVSDSGKGGIPENNKVPGVVATPQAKDPVAGNIMSGWPQHEGGAEHCWSAHGVRDVVNCIRQPGSKVRGNALSVVGDSASVHASPRLALLMPFTRWDASILMARIAQWNEENYFPCACRNPLRKPTSPIPPNRGKAHQSAPSPAELGPIQKCDGACDRPVDLILYFHQDLDRLPALRQQIVETVEKSIAVSRCFSEWWVLNANLTAAEDRFNEDGTGGPNTMFYRFFSSSAVGKRYDFVLLLEPDAHPIRQDWLSAFCSDIRRHAPFWIRGLPAFQLPSHTALRSKGSGVDDEPLGPKTARGASDFSPSGNAVYRPGDECFRAFVQNTQEIEPSLPFWSALTAFRENPSHFALYAATAPLFQHSDLIWDFSHLEFSGKELRSLSPATFIVHGSRDVDEEGK